MKKILAIFLLIHICSFAQESVDEACERLRKLSWTAGVEAVPELIKAQSADPRVADMALYVFQRIRDAEADKMLVAAYPQIPAWREPMASVKLQKGTKKDEFLEAYVTSNPSKMPWRELASILSVRESGGRKSALALRHLESIPDREFTLWTGGLYSEKAKEIDTVEWKVRLSVGLLEELAMLRYEKAIIWADRQRGGLYFAAAEYAKAVGTEKASGVFLGCCGALILIYTSAAHSSDKVGDIRGDLLCLLAQLSFALYLSLFNKLIKRYSVFTINKWMFLWATVFVTPFTFSHVSEVVSHSISSRSWLEAGYVVFFGTYISYILTMIGQKKLRPTVVSVYNYVQPLVSVVVSVLTGIGVLRPSHALAVVLVFSGVWLVTISRSRADMERKAQEIQNMRSSR